MENGDKFGYWTVLDTSVANKENNYKARCRCICGTDKLVRVQYLESGKSKSCKCNGMYSGRIIGDYKILNIYSGKKRSADFLCLDCGCVFKKTIANGEPRNPCQCKFDKGANRKHGESPHKTRTKEYNAWRSMRQRCNSPANSHYNRYGGRGIRVCERWNDYENFIKDMGRCEDGLSLDRINPNGNYEPENCRWANKRDQSINRGGSIKLTFDGFTDYLCYWADRAGLSRATVYQRYRKYGDCGNKELLLGKSNAKSRN